MKKRIIRIVSLLLLIVSISCEEIFEDKHQERFEDPTWLKGSILETLQDSTNEAKKAGNESAGFSIFLRMVDLTGYAESLERGLYSVFVANDASYQEYFSSIGIDSVAQLSEREIKNLLLINVTDFPKSEEKIVYDYIFYMQQKPGSEYGALIFRLPTLSKSAPYKELVKYNESFAGEELLMTSSYKYVPIFSTEFFRDFNGASDGSDYTYFFPDIQWETPLEYNTKFYNANILEDRPCSNGFVFFLDKAVPFMDNLDQFLLKNQDKYGLYYDIMQRFATYSITEILPDSNRTRLYIKSYREPMEVNIASESGPVVTPTEYIRKNIFTAFVPQDEVLQAYLDTTILKYYPVIDSVPQVTLAFLLQAHISKHFDLPSKIEKSFYNYYSDLLPFDPVNDVVEKTILSNGAFYGINKVLEPLAFRTTPGPLFFRDGFNTFLTALVKSGQIVNLTKNDELVTILAPPDDKLEENGIRYDFAEEELQIIGTSGEWETMIEEEIRDLVNDYIIYYELENLTDEGYVTTQSENIFYHKDNYVQSGGNIELSEKVNVTQLLTSSNGKLFLLDNVLKKAKKTVAQNLKETADFSSFYLLCEQAGLITNNIAGEDTTVDLSFSANASYWTCYIPDNSAIATGIASGAVPSDSVELINFVKYHFVSDVQLIDNNTLSRAYQTAAADTLGEAYSLQVSITPGNMQVTDLSEQTVSVSHQNANLLAKDAVIHKIQSVLKLD